MRTTSTGQSETGFDQVLAFAIPDRDCRGRIVRLGPVLETILAAHDYPPALKMLLAEALVLTSLMGGLLKGEGDQLTLQARTGGGLVSLLVCDYRDGELRGYVEQNPECSLSIADKPDLAVLFGEGCLAITFDIASTGQRYQGVVPLEGASLAEAVENYFARSEQIPTLIRTGVRAEGDGCVAGGMLVQHLAQGEEGRERLHIPHDNPMWEEVSAITRSVRDDELVDSTITLEAMIWRLYHEHREVRIEPMATIERGCRCSELHFEEVLARFPSQDRKEMRDANGVIKVDCGFCSRQFAIQD